MARERQKEKRAREREKGEMNLIQMKASTSFVSMDVVTFYGILLHAYQHARKNEVWRINEVKSHEQRIFIWAFAEKLYQSE